MKADSTKRPVIIVDTTLRDGGQAPGVVFSLREKITIVRLMDSAGVTELEVGIPAMGHATCEEIRELTALEPTCLFTALCRALGKDIDLAAACGTDGVHISFPVSTAPGRSKTLQPMNPFAPKTSDENRANSSSAPIPDQPQSVIFSRARESA